MVNLITNGEFTTDTSGWYTYPPTNATFERWMYTIWPVARITFLQSGAGFQLYQSGFPIVAGATYKLDFDARCNTGKSFGVDVIQHGSPYTNLGLTAIALLTSNWSHYTYTFTATMSELNSRLMFWFDRAVVGDIYDIDAVVLEQTSVPPPITYDCVGNQCVQNNTGTGVFSTLLACQNSGCGTQPAITYDCISGQCIQNSQGTGQYASLSACQLACISQLPSQPSELSVGWVVVGLYTGMIFGAIIYSKNYKEK